MNEEKKEVKTSEPKRLLKVGITQGDNNGIGYEVILKTFEDETMHDICTSIVYGSPRSATYHRKNLNLETNFTLINSAEEAHRDTLNMISCYDEELKIEIGKVSAEGGKSSVLALDRAVKDLKEGKIDILVTAPICKAAMRQVGFQYPGHTEYLQDKLGTEEPGGTLMILMNDVLRVALVTTHIPISEVPKNITKENIIEKINIFFESLKKDFLISMPRIAVLSLNPHSSDEGLLGNEEENIIKPAIEEANKDRQKCFGPYAADGFFGSGMYKHFDGVLAMYHDQGLAAFKALADDDGVNFTANLNGVRTSPAHGTAFDIAGKGEANENSLRQAIFKGIDIYNNRKMYNEAKANKLEIKIDNKQKMIE